MNHRIAAFAAALILVLVYLAPAAGYAVEPSRLPEKDGGETAIGYSSPLSAVAGDTIQITDFTVGDQVLPPYLLYCLEIGGDPGTLDLPEQVFAWTGRFSGIYVDIRWRYDEFAADAPGLCSIWGDMVLPPGYTYSGEAAAEIAVLVYDPQAEPVMTVNQIDNIFPASPILPLGSSSGALDGFLSGIGQTTLENLWFYLDSGDGDESYYIKSSSTAHIDASRIHTGEVGTYYPLRYSLPSCFDFHGFALQDMAVHVMDPGQVDLRGWTAYRTSITFRYLKELEEPELWMARGDGEWQKVPEDGELISSIQSNSIEIDIQELEMGTRYSFEVRYENGGRSVNIFVLDLTNGLPREGPVVGDRTGGDRNPGGEVPLPPGTDQGDGDGGEEGASSTGNNPSSGGSADGLRSTAGDGDVQDIVTFSPLDVAQEPESPDMAEFPAAAEQEPIADVGESHVDVSYGEYTQMYTGAQFAAMTEAADDYLLFTGRDNLVLWFPKSEAVALGRISRFALHLSMPEEKLVRVGFAVDGEAVTGSFTEAFLVGIPWNGGEVAATDEDGIPLPCGYGQDGLLLLTAHAPGVYRLAPQEAVAVSAGLSGAAPGQESTESSMGGQEQDHTPLGGYGVVALAGAALAGGTLTTLRLRRRKGEK